MSHNRTVILGGGVTGLAAGLATGWPVFEATGFPGGLCASYYVDPARPHERLLQAPDAGRAYRFEYGGGHWIFGGDPAIHRFIEQYAPTRTYTRRSAVFFAQTGQQIPFPLQHHVDDLGTDLAQQIRNEWQQQGVKQSPVTMAEVLRNQFGATLYRLFFEPFNRRYTAGLFTQIAPQDGYKSPRASAHPPQKPAGYNITFRYPVAGLGALAQRMAAACNIQYHKKAIAVDVAQKTVHFADSTEVPYDRLMATVPLHHMQMMTGISCDEKTDPHTSVLVLNIGAERGVKNIEEHWVYIPDSQSGFYRVGFYSNISSDFVPGADSGGNERVSLYVERAYLGGQRPAPAEEETYIAEVIKELQDWGWIGAVEVVDPTWIDVAYTWRYPHATWRETMLATLAAHDITMAGRYARWHFQGIADSIREGLAMGDSG